MEKKLHSIKLKQIRPTRMDPETGFSYDVDYEIELEAVLPAKTSAKITGTLTVQVAFQHGKQKKHRSIEDIDSRSRQAIRERFSELVEQLKARRQHRS